MKNPKITIIDYGIGNVHSVYNAIKSLGYNRIKISRNENDIISSDALILPGVGAFDACVRNLNESKIIPILNNVVLNENKPILGICVGMQLMASFSEENGRHNGLGWIKGSVKKFVLPNQYSVPHVGWNSVHSNSNSNLFNNNDQNTNFYFDHSYYFDCDDKYIAAYCNYGIKVTAAVEKDNIFGVQFHPEKSQTGGLKLFRGFFKSI